MAADDNQLANRCETERRGDRSETPEEGAAHCDLPLSCRSMTADAHAASEFYRTSRGAVTARLLRARIATLWPDMEGCSVLGIGYTAPYLRAWEGSAYRRIALTPAQIGAIRWPPDAPNLSCTAEEDALPFPDLMFDRILIVHGLEVAENARRMLREAWRVLKDDGRLLIVTPNRTGHVGVLGKHAVRAWAAVHGRPTRAAAVRRTVPGGAARHRAVDAAVARRG